MPGSYPVASELCKRSRMLLLRKLLDRGHHLQLGEVGLAAELRVGLDL